LKVKKKTQWIPVEGSHSFVADRFFAKGAVKRFLNKKIKDSQSARFLTGLVTGEFNDKMMLFTFGKLGLSHIMAISGFHFALVTLFLYFLFSICFPRKIAAILLLIALSAYFFFLGCTASIARAWISSALFSIAQLMERRSDSLNTLGIAMIICLLIDPLMVQSLGFQFSFLATAGILLFFSPAHSMLLYLYEKRFLSQMIHRNHLKQIGYILSVWWRQGLALLIAVHLTTIPLMLFYFGMFPWMSLLYNLFFPLLVAIALGGLMLGSLISWLLPFFSDFIFSLITAYTKWILGVALQTPLALDIAWRVRSVPTELVIIYLSVLILAGVLLYQRECERELAY
jgi:competence protein ComEC